jgi:tetratricopeptide (TPR) repeat protein
MMRLTPVLPFLIWTVCRGTRAFLAGFPAPRRSAAFLLLLAASCFLDFYHLFQVYPSSWKDVRYYGDHKSTEFYRAYSLLAPLAGRNGPGLILLHFNPDPYDQTLFVSTFAFNTAENPRLGQERPTWAAVLANSHERDAISREFPGSTWAPLSDGLGRKDGGMILEWIPVNEADRDRLDRWVGANQSLAELDRLVMERGVDPDQGPMLGVLSRAYPNFKGDPLLESRYWRITALHHAAGGDFASAVSDESKAIRQGLPLAHLYNELGCLLFKEGDGAGARRAFQSALAARPNLTNALENLGNLSAVAPGRP